MRTPLTCVGAAMIVVYAVAGALLMNRWALPAASETSLSRTITAMDAAGQHYSAVPGLLFAALGILLFAALGILLAGGWCARVLLAQHPFPSSGRLLSGIRSGPCGRTDHP